MLHLGRPQTLDDSLSLLYETLRERYRPWRLPFSQRERLAPREKTALAPLLATAVNAA
ncbi:MAG: hypothetical protein V7K92_29890 [Nostoc sp.]